MEILKSFQLFTPTQGPGYLFAQLQLLFAEIAATELLLLLMTSLV
jgi:hypothetical protein